MDTILFFSFRVYENAFCRDYREEDFYFLEG
jgi:hypothetical protein